MALGLLACFKHLEGYQERDAKGLASISTEDQMRNMRVNCRSWENSSEFIEECACVSKTESSENTLPEDQRLCLCLRSRRRLAPHWRSLNISIREEMCGVYELELSGEQVTLKLRHC